MPEGLLSLVEPFQISSTYHAILGPIWNGLGSREIINQLKYLLQLLRK